MDTRIGDKLEGQFHHVLRVDDFWFLSFLRVDVIVKFFEEWKKVIFMVFVFFLIGLIVCISSRYQSNIDVKLHPTLPTLTFWEALFSGHFWSWCWTVAPSLMFTITLSFCVFIGFVAGCLME